MSRLRASGDAFRRITDAAEFGQVAVLMGGASAEREVSLMTGNAVLEALVSSRRECHCVRSGHARAD